MHNYSFLGLCGFSSGETKGSMAHFHFENVLRERTCKWNHLSCWPQALFPWDNRMATLLLKPLMLTLENGCPLNKPDRRHDYLKMTCCLLLLGQRQTWNKLQAGLQKACKPSFFLGLHGLSGFLGLKKLGLPDQSLAWLASNKSLPMFGLAWLA